MNVVFEVREDDIDTIAELKTRLEELLVVEEENENGLDGNNVVALIVALVPSVIDIVKEYVSKTTVTIKVSTPDGCIEISSTSPQKAIKQLEQVSKMLKEVHKEEDDKGD